MDKGISTNAKVGIFVFIVLGILFWITFKIGGTIFGSPHGYTILAYFDNAQGLDTKTGVYLAGIKIGSIANIKLQNDRALVTLRILSGIQIKENAKAVIRTKGLLGEEYIEIIPGKQIAAPIKPGGQFISTESPPDLEETMHKLDGIATDIKSVTQSLRDVFGGANGEKNIKDMVNNLNMTITHIDRIVTNTNTNLNETFASVNVFAEALKVNGPDILVNLATVSKELHEIIAGNKGSINKTIDNVSSASEKLNKTLANIERITDNLKEGKGTIGKLLSDKKTEEQVSKVINGLSNMVEGASQSKLFVDFYNEYQVSYNNVKSYLDLRLQPSPDTYYLAGLINEPGYYSANSQLKINLEIAKRISYFTFRGGIIESSGGIGVDISTPSDRARLSVEAFDYNKKPYPELKTMLSVSIVRYFLILGGMTDIANREYRTWFFGVGLSFSYADIKSL